MCGIHEQLTYVTSVLLILFLDQSSDVGFSSPLTFSNLVRPYRSSDLPRHVSLRSSIFSLLRRYQTHTTLLLPLQDPTVQPLRVTGPLFLHLPSS